MKTREVDVKTQVRTSIGRARVYVRDNIPANVVVVGPRTDPNMLTLLISPLAAKMPWDFVEECEQALGVLVEGMEIERTSKGPRLYQPSMADLELQVESLLARAHRARTNPVEYDGIIAESLRLQRQLRGMAGRVDAALQTLELLDR